MFCSNCGEENEDDAQFCETCGSPIKPIINNPKPKKIPKWALIGGGCCIGLFLILLVIGMVVPEKITVDGVDFNIPSGYEHKAKFTTNVDYKVPYHMTTTLYTKNNTFDKTKNDLITIIVASPDNPNDDLVDAILSDDNNNDEDTTTDNTDNTYNDEDTTTDNTDNTYNDEDTTTDNTDNTYNDEDTTTNNPKTEIERNMLMLVLSNLYQGINPLDMNLNHEEKTIKNATGNYYEIFTPKNKQKNSYINMKGFLYFKDNKMIFITSLSNHDKLGAEIEDIIK